MESSRGANYTLDSFPSAYSAGNGAIIIAIEILVVAIKSFLISFSVSGSLITLLIDFEVIYKKLPDLITVLYVVANGGFNSAV